MSSNDEKRNRRIELSHEAIALKKMRELRSMSVRDVGDLLNVSFECFIGIVFCFDLIIVKGLGRLKCPSLFWFKA